MFNIEFLSSTGQKTLLQNQSINEVLRYTKSIDWLNEISNYYRAYRGIDDVNYEDYWYLDIENTIDNTMLNVFTNYMDETKISEGNLSFVITYHWQTNVPNSWLGKLFSGKTEVVHWESRHTDNADINNFREIINLFTSSDLTNIETALNLMGDYEFNVD